MRSANNEILAIYAKVLLHIAESLKRDADECRAANYSPDMTAGLVGAMAGHASSILIYAKGIEEVSND